MAEPKKGLALLLGLPSKGGRSGDSEGPDDVNDSAKGDDMAAEFEQAAVDAFPDMEGKPERIAALKQCIRACMDSYDDDSTT
jgi:hypothetical protein